MYATDGANKFEISKANVTNDLEIARSAFVQDSAAMAAVARMRAEETKRAGADMTGNTASNGQHSQYPYVAPQPTPNPLDKPAYNQHYSESYPYYYWHNNYYGHN
jgi:hypothetical protein